MLKSDDTILLVEDDRVDIMTVQRALKRNEIDMPLRVARTGLEALSMLRGEDGCERISPPPALILLGLTLNESVGAGGSFTVTVVLSLYVDGTTALMLTSSILNIVPLLPSVDPT